MPLNEQKLKAANDELLTRALNDPEATPDEIQQIKAEQSRRQTGEIRGPKADSRPANIQAPLQGVPGREFIEPALQIGGPMAGAAAGGALGAKLGTAVAPALGPLAPAGPLVGLGLGSLAGGVLGAVGAQEATVAPDEQRDLLSITKEEAQNTALGLPLWAVAAGGKAFQGVRRARQLKPAQRELEQRAMGEAERLGVAKNVTTGMRQGGTAARVEEGVAKNWLFTGYPAEYQKIFKAIDSEANELLESAPTSLDAGNIIGATHTKMRQTAMQALGSAVGDVRQRAALTPENTFKAYKTATDGISEALSEFKLTPKRISGGLTGKLSDSVAKDALSYIKIIGDNKSFPMDPFDLLREQIGRDLAGESDRFINRHDRRFLGKVYQAISNGQKEFFTAADRQALDAANKAYSEFAKADEALYWLGRRGYNAKTAVKDILTDDETRKAFENLYGREQLESISRSWLIDNALQMASDGGRNWRTLKKFEDSIAGLGNGADALPAQQVERIRGVLALNELAKRVNTGAAGAGVGRLTITQELSSLTNPAGLAKFLATGAIGPRLLADIERIVRSGLASPKEASLLQGLLINAAGGAAMEFARGDETTEQAYQPRAELRNQQPQTLQQLGR